MNKIIIERSKEKINSQDIQNLESKFNFVLPGNFKKLILKYNGGYIDDAIYLDTLYSIKFGSLTIENAINDLQILEENIPRDYLPFANTGTGNQITIFLKEGNDYGKIFLFRYDEVEPKKIADSLEELFGVKNIEDL
jgi:cell wall assembly regulator SMI1